MRWFRRKPEQPQIVINVNGRATREDAEEILKVLRKMARDEGRRAVI